MHTLYNYDDAIQSLCRPGYANDLLRGVVNVPIYSKVCCYTISSTLSEGLK